MSTICLCLIVLINYEFPVWHKRSQRDAHGAGNGHSHYQLKKCRGAGIWLNTGPVQNRRSIDATHTCLFISCLCDNNGWRTQRFDDLKASPLLSSLCINISWIKIASSGHFHTDNNRESRGEGKCFFCLEAGLPLF